MKPLALGLLLLSAPAVRADEQAAPPAAAPEAAPAPELTALEKILTEKQEARKKGELSPEQYREFVAKFRGDLEEATRRVPPSPENKGMAAIIASRLDEEGRGQALHGLDSALKDDPGNPTLLRAKAQIYYEKKDYAAAAAAARQAGVTATSWLKLAEGRTAGEAGAPSAPSMTVRDPELKTETDKPYVLAVPGSAKLCDVPAVSVPGGDLPHFNGLPMVSKTTTLWGGASDGLVMKGVEWLDSANASGENGLSGIAKFGRKAVGKGFVAAGGVMEVLPQAVAWTADKQYRLMTGDVSAIGDASKGLYGVGKAAAVGFVEDARVAASDWGDLVTLKKPTVYQALKATGRTEAILANFLPVGLAARGTKVGATTVEVALEGAGRGALHGAEKRAIAHFAVDRIKVTARGVEAVETHLARFGADAPNAVMIDRLKKISRGDLAATSQDLQFYAHELREKVLYRQANIPDGMAASYEVGSRAHARALKEYGLTNDPADLYHPEADVAGDNARILKNHGLKTE